MNYEKCMKTVSKLAIVSVDKPRGISAVKSLSEQSIHQERNKSWDKWFRVCHNFAIVK